MEKIGLFCSACNTIDEAYFHAASLLGEWLGREGKTLIYGGSNQGLMECVAKAVKENGGTVVGVVPDKLEEKGRVSALSDTVYRTRNLSERKELVTELADVLIAMPGGIGTLDEAFHVMAAASIGYHSKRVIFYNINGFFDPLFSMLHSMDEKRFTRHPLSKLCSVATNLEEIKTLL